MTKLNYRGLAAFIPVVAVVMLLSGCYTRLTTPKEAREWRATYAELESDDNLIVDLGNGKMNMGNTFIMPVEVYMEAVRRFDQNQANAPLGSRNAYRFRPGSLISIRLPGHPADPINEIYTVRPEGTIDIGQFSNFQVAGRTSDEVRRDLQGLLDPFYLPYPDNKGPVHVEVNIPTFKEGLGIGDRSSVGFANVMGLGGGSGATGGRVTLRGDDTLLSVLSESGRYSSDMDWHEIAVLRKISTQRVDPVTKQNIEYYIIIMVDLEKLVYEDPNLNMDIRDRDIIIMHVEKAPLIVELVRTAQTLTGIYGDFQGVEGVLEDVFHRNF